MYDIYKFGIFYEDFKQDMLTKYDINQNLKLNIIFNFLSQEMKYIKNKIKHQEHIKNWI